MTRVDIKICGLSTPETLEAALNGGATHVGFVHFPKSPRHVSVSRLADLSRIVPPSVRKVGVVVDADGPLLQALISAGDLDVLQLHGKETPERAARLKSRTRLEIWKAISVKSARDLRAARDYEGLADMVLFDAKTPDGAALPGGMGMRFDWSLLSGYRPFMPWGLSGGLNPENVVEAIRTTRAPLVDVSSGVERAPGVKDVDKIAAFCKVVSQC